MKENRVIVAGSRDFLNYEVVELTLNRILEKTLPQHPARRDLEIVSGTARGADKLGERWARDNQIPIKRFPAEWRKGGRLNMAAGHERNQRMAEYATHLIAFWNGRSTGTAHMIRRAEQAGLKVKVIRV